MGGGGGAVTGGVVVVIEGPPGSLSSVCIIGRMGAESLDDSSGFTGALREALSTVSYSQLVLNSSEQHC